MSKIEIYLEETTSNVATNNSMSNIVETNKSKQHPLMQILTTGNCNFIQLEQKLNQFEQSSIKILEKVNKLEEENKYLLDKVAMFERNDDINCTQVDSVKDRSYLIEDEIENFHLTFEQLNSEFAILKKPKENCVQEIHNKMEKYGKQVSNLKKVIVDHDSKMGLLEPKIDNLEATIDSWKEDFDTQEHFERMKNDAVHDELKEFCITTTEQERHECLSVINPIKVSDRKLQNCLARHQTGGKRKKKK